MSNLFKNYGSRIAAIDEFGCSISYDEMEQMTKEIKSVIDGRCLVFALCSNTIGSVAGYVSFQKNDIVPLMISEKIDKSLLNHLISVYKPEYIWAPSGYDFDDKSYLGVFQTWGYTLVKTNYKSYALAEDLALLLTTSGSTGSPKLVRQSYKNIEANTKSIVEYLEIDENEKPITTLPMNYTYGLSIINTHLYVGATIVLTDKAILQKEFWELFKKENVTSMGGVPYTYEMLYKLRFFNMDLPSLKYMTQAGGKLSPTLHKKFAEYASDKKIKFIVMYGQTEATARMAYLPFEKSIEKYGSMGIAIPGGKFTVIDVNGNEIKEPNQAGELVYTGDNVTLGYAECGEDLSRGDERGGILYTGDMAKFDEDGYFFIVGRKKRFLKIYGNRVNLDECEGLLRDKFPSNSFACGGVDDKLYIFTDASSEEIQKEVRQFIAERTGINISAFKICYVEEIPKNESGKVLYSKLQELIGVQ